MENKDLKNIKILITGVHFTPALSVLEELEKRGYHNFVWVGRKYRILGTKEPVQEYKVITGKKIPFIHLVSGKLQRTLDLSFFLWLIRIPIGFIQSLYILLRYKPKIIITFGSYVGVPIAFFGWILRIPIIVHEQVLVGGLANNIISKFATKVCLSWNTKSNKKYIYTGNPIQQEILNSTTDEYQFADMTKPVIAFIAGGTGSHILNTTILGAVTKLSKKYNIIHQTGMNAVVDDFALGQKIAEEINKDGVKYIPTINYSGGEVYKKSHIIVSRCGANTIYELAALGKISLLVPIPFSRNDEQTKNAEMLVDAGTALILHQNTLTIDTLISSLGEIESNYDSMKACISKAQNLVVLDADQKIADIIENRLKKIKTINNIEAVKKSVTQPDEKIDNKPKTNLALNKIKSTSEHFKHKISEIHQKQLEKKLNKEKKNNQKASAESLATNLDEKKKDEISANTQKQNFENKTKLKPNKKTKNKKKGKKKK